MKNLSRDFLRIVTQSRWILLFACLAGGFGALRLGFALEWDLLNYHLYNPHALWTGRMAIDVAPAQLQTYLNPALFLPLYLVFKFTNAAVMVFVVGAIQASQLLLLLLILKELTGQSALQWWQLLTVAVMGLLGPVFLNQLGGTQGDTLLSILVLSGLLMVLRELKRSDSETTVKAGILSGLLLGMACGLKLTIALYAISLAAASFVCFSGAKRWRIVVGLALGGTLGVLLSGGAWYVLQWQTYQSPLFPYLNNILGSPWIEKGSYRDLRFLPQSVSEWLFYPVYWLMDPHRVWEFPFRDIRMPLLIATAFTMPLFYWRRVWDKAPALGLVCLFVAFTYLLWIKLFSIYRYLSVLELLAPVVIFSSFLLFVRSRRGLLIMLLALVSTQALVVHHRTPASWEFQPGTQTVFKSLPPDSMVVIDGYFPVAYAALWLDDSIPLVRIRANFMRTSEPQHRLHEYAQQAVRNHRGVYFLLLPEEEAEEPFITQDLAWVGLTLTDSSACQPVFAVQELQNKLRLKLCPLERLVSRTEFAPSAVMSTI
jgi:hypothetical protein